MDEKKMVASFKKMMDDPEFLKLNNEWELYMFIHAYGYRDGYMSGKSDCVDRLKEAMNDKENKSHPG